MRPDLEDLLPPPSSPSSSSAAVAAAAAAPHPSQWRASSPVPYLFAGLAAMLGIIALALLLLACSYWNLSGHLDDPSSPSPAAAADGRAGAEKRGPAAEERVVVIVMAGEEKPTYLGTPVDAKPKEAKSIYKEEEEGEGEEGGGSLVGTIDPLRPAVRPALGFVPPCAL